MKKISEFTGSNNVIHITTKKEAKGIAKLLPGYEDVVLEAYSKYYGNVCIRPVKPGDKIKTVYYSDYNHAEKNGYTIHKASEFLPKKSKLEKRVKILEIQMAERMDAQIQPIKLEYRELHKVDMIEDIEVKDAQQELTKLPEKWCVAHSEEALEWIRNNAEINGPFIIEEEYYYFPKDSSGNNGGSESPEGYTEITFDQFKKWVLKEDVSKMESTEPVKLEVGKWYKGDSDKDISLYFITEVNDFDFSAYGLNWKGEWVDNKKAFGIVNGPHIRLATTEEISTALIAEAKKRGFVKGITFSSLVSGRSTVREDNLIYVYVENRIYANDDHGTLFGVIFDNGQWAEIVPQEFDWSKPGQLVTLPSGNVWEVIQDKNDVEFIGIQRVYNKKNVCVFSENILKNGMRPYTGEPIILK